MNLDIRTMIVMMSALNFLFAGLLALAGLHADKYRGIRHWALASLFIGLGFSSAYFQIEPPFNLWFVVFGSSAVAMGIGLQFNGISAFKTGHCNERIPWLLAGLVFASDLWLSIIKPEIHLRVIVNSLLFGGCNALCARALLIKMEPPLRTAYWFTGVSFTIISLIFFSRGVAVFLSPPGSYTLYSHTPINPLTFFIGNIAQLCLTFGFVLMLNYRLATELHKLASCDALTGAMNRRCLETEATRLTARSLRTGDTLALMIIDVDHFKSVNDRFGHPAGDEVLKRLVEVVQKTIRSDDYFARYGGEEFCILLPSTDEKDAAALAERLRCNYADLTIELGNEQLRSTVSIGVADSKHTGLNFTDMVAAADHAMYRAKQEGRNRVVLHSHC